MKFLGSEDPSLGSNPGFGMVRQVVCPKFGASLNYTMTTKPARVVKQDLVSKGKKGKKDGEGLFSSGLLP